MKRTKLVALLLVAIMAIATVPALAAAEQQTTPAQTPTVGATIRPELSRTHTPRYPARFEDYTVSGRLYTVQAGRIVGLANRPLTLWVMWPEDGPWIWHSTTVTTGPTDANGYYSFHTNSQTKLVWWKIRFAGDAVYYPRNAYEYIPIGQTTTTIATTVANPTPGQHFHIYGYVRDNNHNGLSNLHVNVYVRYWTGAAWSAWAPIDFNPRHTDGNGRYDWETWGSTLNQYYAKFIGSRSHHSSTSPTITVDCR